MKKLMVGLLFLVGSVYGMRPIDGGNTQPKVLRSAMKAPSKEGERVFGYLKPMNKQNFKESEIFFGRREVVEKQKLLCEYIRNELWEKSCELCREIFDNEYLTPLERVFAERFFGHPKPMDKQKFKEFETFFGRRDAVEKQKLLCEYVQNELWEKSCELCREILDNEYLTELEREVAMVTLNSVEALYYVQRYY